MTIEAFLAFPSQPREIRDTIERAVEHCARQKGSRKLIPWTSLDVSGRLISQAILSRINASSLLIADISVLNPNVSYEIGYAIGSNKPLKMVINKLFQARTDEQLRQIGLFDTLGYHPYENSEDLSEYIIASTILDLEPLFVPDGFDRRAPVYLIDGPYQSDISARIVHQARRQFPSILRIFDPREKARLPILEAIENVARSRLVIVSVLPTQYPEADIHNIRSSFVAGLAHGVGRSLVIYQLGLDAPPLDFRDDVTLAVEIAQVDRRIQAVAPEVYRSLVLEETPRDLGAPTFLEALNIGSNVAEEEEDSLASYYYAMDPYFRAARGEARVVTGRKGSGKSALFYRLASDKTSGRQMIVLALQPESYQLIKFKEDVLRLLTPGTQLHILTAIWDYILLLELAQRLLEADKHTYQRDHRLFDRYVELHDVYYVQEAYTEADFSERLSHLLSSVASEITGRTPGDGLSLSSNEITEIIYRHPLRKLRDSLHKYMAEKEGLWILVDHLDKGWASTGLEPEDVQIVRALLDASNKLRRSFNRDQIDCCVLAFLRDDVFQLLLETSTESGKISKVTVDCSDREALKQILGLRLRFAGLSEDLDVDQMWLRICCPEISGSTAIDYLLDRCLMRPRALLGLVAACRNRAVNRGHERMEIEDVRDGVRDYSQDLLRDVMQEIGDVAPQLESGLYALIDAPASFSRKGLNGFYMGWHIKRDEWDKLTEYFLWYGVLGVEVSDGLVRYIYDFNYDFSLLSAVVKKQGMQCRYWINPAFRPGLAVSDPMAQGTML